MARPRRVHTYESPEGLEPEAAALVGSVLRGDEASLPVSELPDSSGLPAAMAGGWLAVWSLPGGDRVTLTSKAAEAFGAELVERDRVVYHEPDENHEESYRQLCEVPRWEPIAGYRPRPRMPRVRGFVPLNLPEAVPSRPAQSNTEPARPALIIMGVVAGVFRGQRRPRFR